jgi:exopolysaccharide production protein ExoQ
MISTATAPTTSSRAAERLWRAAALILAVMPLIFVIANRSSPLLLSIAAAAALAASAMEGNSRSAWANVRAALQTPVGLSVSAFLAWAALSMAWSDMRSASLFALGEFLVPVIAAWFLALTLPGRMPPSAMWVFAASLVLACILINVELATDTAWRRALGWRWDAFIFNRPILTFLAISAPLIWCLAQRGSEWAAAVVALLLVLTVFRGLSAAAVLGLFTGALVYLAARFILRRHAIPLAGCGLLAALALAPVAGEMLDRFLPSALYAKLDASSQVRVDIYRSFGAAVDLHPVAGAGFAASHRYDRTPAAARLAPEHRTLTGVGHPHNAALQIWVELGVVGALLAAFVLALVLRSWIGLPVETMAPRLALLTAAAAVALVGHGAWQGWWAAALGATAVWFRSADRLLAAKPS